jgi:hypothetical protein
LILSALSFFEWKGECRYVMFEGHPLGTPVDSLEEGMGCELKETCDRKRPLAVSQTKVLLSIITFTKMPR